MVYLHLPYFIPELIEVTDERTTDHERRNMDMVEDELWASSQL